jgi:hypothetical protein
MATAAAKRTTKGAKRRAPAPRRERRRDATGAKGKRDDGARYWSARVTRESNALELEPGVFKHADPRAVARSLKRSADASTRRKSDPYRSAMSMLTFYLNRAGRNLAARQRRVLERAKDELRRLYGRPPRAG